METATRKLKKLMIIILKKYIFIILPSFLILFAAAFSLSYIFIITKNHNRVMPNTHFSHFSLAGRDREEVELIVKRSLEIYRREKIPIYFEDTKHEFTADELGIDFDEQSVVDEIFAQNSQGSVIESLKKIFTDTKILNIYYVDGDRFTAGINSKFGFLEKWRQDAGLEFGLQGIIERKSSVGHIIDRSRLTNDLKYDLENLRSDPIRLEFISEEPRVVESSMQNALNQVKKLNALKITLTFGLDRWLLDNGELYKLLSFNPEGQSSVEFAKIGSQKPIVISRAYVRTPQPPQLELSLNRDNIEEYLDSIAKVIDRSARDATLRYENGKVVEFTSAQDGQKLDRVQAHALISQELKKAVANDNLTISVKLPVNVTNAKIANVEINNLGIRELVGSGVSYFSGSIANRVHNIGLGSSLINGVLVKPGETFSFLEYVGGVTAEQGFRQAYVIKSGRTVLDDGGGICQVSTTVFRAALNSGLPILERTAHAYRVSYYEQKGFKAGLDATIFSPTVDLKFKNDTNKYLLIQTTVNNAQSRLQVDIYGTRDGRTVELTEPVISNVRPAPEPLYQDEPTLQKGIVKQVDFAASGATSIFSRKVYKDGDLVINESFKSVFRPWQAVFLVGTAG